MSPSLVLLYIDCIIILLTEKFTFPTSNVTKPIFEFSHIAHTGMIRYIIYIINDAGGKRSFEEKEENIMSLKKKLLLVVSVCIALLSLSGLISNIIITRAYARLLQETVANNLASSSSAISSFLNVIEDISTSLLADSLIQQNLILVNESTNPREQTLAYQTLSRTISNYYDQCKSFYVDYITLYGSQHIVYSNFLRNQRTPSEIEEKLLTLADENEGRPVWVFEYAQDNGFYLSRQIRNIQSPHFDSLGTLIISVNLDQIIEGLNNQDGAFPDTRYFMVNDDSIIYQENSITKELYRQLPPDTSDFSRILTADGHKYYVYRTSILDRDLSYICYVSYDSVVASTRLSRIISIVLIVFTCLIAVILSQLVISSIGKQTQLLVSKMQSFNTESLPDTTSKAPDTASDSNDEFQLLNQQFDSMSDRIHHLIQVNYVNELWKKDAQFKALEKQIQPHFLYNTLESINWRAKSAGVPDISNMVNALGSLLRASLTEDNGNWTLKKELDVTSSYITIQKYRFEEHLDYHLDCDPLLLDAHIPKFTIQPLVENAIHYGLEENDEICHIIVQCRLEPDTRELSLLVQNTGSVFEEALLEKLRTNQISANGFGIGLINIDRRIQLTFGTEYGLHLYNKGEQAVAKIKIPYANEEVFPC